MERSEIRGPGLRAAPDPELSGFGHFIDGASRKHPIYAAARPALLLLRVGLPGRRVAFSTESDPERTWFVKRVDHRVAVMTCARMRPLTGPFPYCRASASDDFCVASSRRDGSPASISLLNGVP